MARFVNMSMFTEMRGRAAHPTCEVGGTCDSSTYLPESSPTTTYDGASARSAPRAASKRADSSAAVGSVDRSLKSSGGGAHTKKRERTGTGGGKKMTMKRKLRASSPAISLYERQSRRIRGRYE